MADDPRPSRPAPTRHDAGADSISVSELLQRHGHLTPPPDPVPPFPYPPGPNGFRPRDIGAVGVGAEGVGAGGAGDLESSVAITDVQSAIDSGQLFITELLRREGRLDEPPPPPPRPARSYRPMVAAAAIALVCGIATAGIAALAGDRDDRPDPEAVAAVALLRGPDALLPDVIQTTMDGISALAGAAAIDATTPPPESAPETVDVDASTNPVTGVVTAFFQTAPSAPADAYQLLDADLRGAGIEDFTGSWDGISQVRIDSVERDGRDVRIAVSLVRDDGTTLWLVERLRVQSDLIVEAALLSAAVSR